MTEPLLKIRAHGSFQQPGRAFGVISNNSLRSDVLCQPQRVNHWAHERGRSGGRREDRIEREGTRVWETKEVEKGQTVKHCGEIEKGGMGWKWHRGVIGGDEAEQ